MRCEDYPCCGHAGDLDGCPDFSRTNKCKKCGMKFHPDNTCWDYCLKCNSEEYDRDDGFGPMPDDE